MGRDVIDFKVKDLELKVDSVEDILAIARMFEYTEMFEGIQEWGDGKYWINKGGEGVVMRFGKEGDQFVLEKIVCFGECSGDYRIDIGLMFREFGGKITAEITLEDDSRYTMRVGYGGDDILQ